MADDGEILEKRKQKAISGDLVATNALALLGVHAVVTACTPTANTDETFG